MTGTLAFIDRHGLWSNDQKKRAEELKTQVEKDKPHLVRLAWSDTHGYARAKVVTAPVFVEALSNGYNINVATATLDAAGGRVFSSFTPGGGMGLEEMTGSPNLIIVPDPFSYRTLPWADGIGWVLCDLFFVDGRPFHFSPRQVLQRQLRRLADMGMKAFIGLEVEWYLARITEERLEEKHIGFPGMRGRPVATTPPEPGYAYHSESNMDLMQPMLSELSRVYEQIRLPLRSMENEWGPGQVECTFAASHALKAADDLILFRSATRQVCRRHGYLASFMCRPGIKGYYSSGWHLHQSLCDAKTGTNLFMPAGGDGEPLSALARDYLGGLLEHAVPATVFASPTINGYRRFRRNSLAPDRVTWGHDHRGVMVRVLGGAGDPATRLENRVGEPAADPYLYIASQLASGLDGVERKLDPGPFTDAPYKTKHTMLPTRLDEAIGKLDKDKFFRAQFGDIFMEYFVALKRAEIDRFERFCSHAGILDPWGAVTEWEQNEYFDFF